MIDLSLFFDSDYEPIQENVGAESGTEAEDSIEKAVKPVVKDKSIQIPT